MKLYLASESPRRKELLTQLGFEFETVKIDCNEIYPLDLPLEKVASYLAELKSKNFRRLHDDEYLLTADTIVVLDDKILGKPKDKSEAKKNASKSFRQKAQGLYRNLPKKQSRNDYENRQSHHRIFRNF